MNFKNTWKRANEGFTLVELIVVIAILAILAGVAVPAYSGYIKKANEAADNQVLSAVNTAFAAACLEEGVDFNAVTDARLRTAANGDGLNISGIASVSGVNANVANINNAFKTYLGSETVTTKAINNIQYVRGFGFKKNDGQIVSGNMTAAQLQAAVDRFNGSNYADNVDELYDTVGTLSSALAGEIGRLDLASWLGDDYDSFMSNYNLTAESSDTEKANALIMYTAAATEGVTAQDIMNMAGSDLSNLDQVTETYGAIPTAAMVYGVLTGYANSENVSASFTEAYNQGVTGVSDVYALLNTVKSDSNFGAYLQDTEGKGLTADLDGYLAAMEVVNGHSGSFDLTDSNAFTNEETKALLNSILGR